ncbi:MAG: AAA family ATPase [Candidatus Dependentiae bacterium]|nr:AAA family ATPase [Candidatus Dependentiae bacterium]
MSKKYFYVWLLLMVGSLEMTLFGFFGYESPKDDVRNSSNRSYNGTYYADSKVVNEFNGKKFTDEQRQAMIDFLDKNGLLSQSSMDGMITALNHASFDQFLAKVMRVFFNEVARRDFPEEFGKGLSNGLVKGLNDNLKNNKAIDDLTKNINKSVKQMSDGIGKDLNASIGENSELGKNTQKTINYYTNLVKGAYDSAVLGSMIKTGAVLIVTTAALYSIPFAIRTIERQMKRPKLIIESSQLTTMEQLQALFSTPKNKEPMAAMVFNPSLKKYLDDIVKIVAKSHAKIKAGKTNIKYRNLMLYGPPGTGKTMFAKELARCSGLEFASMSGSSFSKFQEGEAIEALDELFAWAQRCNGLMIFIDEAEAFLSKRENMDPQSKAYQLLNNFLNYTGQRSNKFMIVFATNHKDVLDSAMYRRIDDLIEMPLPSKKQRIDTLILYKNKILMDLKQNEKSLTKSVDHFLTPAVIEQIAQQTKGLSYGELEGIMNNIKTEADILDKPEVNASLIRTVVDRVVKKHQDFTGGKYLGFIED